MVATMVPVPTAETSFPPAGNVIRTWLGSPGSWTQEVTPAAGVQESNVKAASWTPVKHCVGVPPETEPVHPRMMVVVLTTVESTNALDPFWLVLRMLTLMVITSLGSPTSAGGVWQQLGWSKIEPLVWIWA